LSKGLRWLVAKYHLPASCLTLELMARTSTYKPGLAWFALIGSAWVFVLVTLGAFTTSIGAGMAFPDWPLSNGSVNPDGWLTDIAMFAEHSHRLSGTLMGFITIGLAVWLHLKEDRAWLRKLGWWALFIVIIQGIIGGKRVLLDSLNVPGFDMTLGQMLRIPHGILAQVFVVILFAIAAGLSRAWIEGSNIKASALTRQLGFWCVVLLFVQLTVAATMRHNHAGLAIWTFPFSTPDGGLLPETWNYRVTLHFLHRVLAAVIGIAIAYYGHVLWRDSGVPKLIRLMGVGLVLLVVLQIYLGAQIIWTGRSAYMTTGHVTVGALTLAVTFMVAFFTHRNSIGNARA
jgi:cytochrome c oxidase assembly protein subunit 15